MRLVWNRAVVRLFAVCAVAGMVLVAGCDDDAPPPPVPGTPKAAPLALKKAPIAKALEGTQEFKRRSWGASPRDPFVYTLPRASTADDQEDRERSPLENFTLARLKLVAIITGTAVPKAMFTDDDGFGHIAKEGDRIGTGGGIITAIRLNEVEVTSDQSQVLGSDVDLEEDTPGGLPGALAVPVIIRLSDTDIELEKGSASNEALLEELELDRKRKPAGSDSRRVQ
jgi:hypothetical protein